MAELLRLHKGVDIIYGDREYASEAIGGFIITVLAIFFGPFGFGLDLAFSLVALFILVPLYKILFNWFLFEFQSSLKYVGIKYASGVVTVVFVAFMEMIAPYLVILTLFIGVLIYIFTDDIISMVSKAYLNKKEGRILW